MNWKTKLIDLVERSGATFAQAFLSVITVDHHLTQWTAVKIALVAGAYAVAKYLLVNVNVYLGMAQANYFLAQQKPPSTTL
jgi:hypothetical protein